MAKLYPHELIGLEVEVVESTNPSCIGLKGKIVDETKNTIKVGDKVLLKNTIKFKIIETGEVISGEMVMKRPEDRLKG